MTGLYDLWLCSLRIGVPEVMVKVDGKIIVMMMILTVTHPSSHLRVGWTEGRGAAGL